VTKRTDFVPFKIEPWNHEGAPATLVLRLRAESPDWYEVEVNEKTRETKFAPRGAYRMWTKVPGSFWLYKSVHLKIGGKEIKLLDAPNGKIIADASEINFDWVRFVRSEGDWALVEEYVGGHKYSGWIRWRNGREILVGQLKYH